MINEKLLEKFERLSNKKKVPILLTAISHMQRYNGRSVEDCVCISMLEHYPELESNEKK